MKKLQVETNCVLHLESTYCMCIAKRKPSHYIVLASPENNNRITIVCTAPLPRCPTKLEAAKQTLMKELQDLISQEYARKVVEDGQQCHQCQAIITTNVCFVFVWVSVSAHDVVCVWHTHTHTQAHMCSQLTQDPWGADVQMCNNAICDGCFQELHGSKVSDSLWVGKKN